MSIVEQRGIDGCGRPVEHLPQTVDRFIVSHAAALRDQDRSDSLLALQKGMLDDPPTEQVKPRLPLNCGRPENLERGGKIRAEIEEQSRKC